MSKKERIKELQDEIKDKELQLKKLNLHVDKSKVCSDLYNKVVLEKAKLTKELEDLQNDTLINKVKEVMPHKKTLISDYFKK